MTRTILLLAAIAALTGTGAVHATGAAAAPVGQTSVIAFGVPGQRVVSETSIPFTVTGGIGVSFHGDPSAGCAAAGVCAYRGTMSAPAAGTGSALILVIQARHRTGEQVILAGDGNGPEVSAVVQRALPGGGSARCSDVAQTQGVFDTESVVHGSRLTLGLFSTSSLPLQTRCAGPPAGALAASAPSAPLSLAALRRGRRTLDLSRSLPFSAGGFTGTITSTIGLRLGTPTRVSTRAQFPPGIRLVRTRSLSESLTVAGVSGQFHAQVAGSADTRVCGLLDSCGLSETIGWTPVAGGGDGGALAVTGRATLPRSRLLAGLGLAHDPRPLGAVGGVSFTDRGPAPVVASQDGSTCHGEVAPRDEQIELATGRHRLAASLVSAVPLRSACPGPFLGGLDSQQILAAGAIRLSALRRRTFTIRLHAAPGVLTDDGYTTRLSGAISITLRRGRITQHIIRVPTP